MQAKEISGYLLTWKVRILLACLVSVLAGVGGPDCPNAMGSGIASRYVGDVGIESDPDVVLSEDFEAGDMHALLSGWEYATHEERMSFSSDVPSVSAGTQSLFMGGSADMYQRLLPGYDQLYIRFYAKFEARCQSPGHWVWLGGRHPSVPWPWPEAGTCPDGDERWSTGVEPMGAHWSWDFYTYWTGMRSAPSGDFWGNTFSGRPSPWPVPKNEWVCVEFMVKMNDPVSDHNGEQAFWINGVKLAHLGPGFPMGTWKWDGFYPDDGGSPFEGFQWRKTQDLAINYVWLEHYVPNDPDCGCWFDDLVIAREYIGPMGADRSTVYVDPTGWCNGYTPCFSSIQEGIDAAESKATIKMTQGKYLEHLTLGDAKDMDLQGGWDAAFGDQISTTTVESITLESGAGTVTVGRLTIE
jgi:hypothetical protein